MVRVHSLPPTPGTLLPEGIRTPSPHHPDPPAPTPAVRACPPAHGAAVEAALHREKDAVAEKLKALPRGRAMHNRLRKKQNALRRFLPDPLPRGEVAPLGEAQFARYVGKSAPALVEFYAPWCAGEARGRTRRRDGAP